MSDDVTPTTEYACFQQAYDFFNARLFSGRLPAVLITLQRRSGSRGYFSPERFVTRVGGDSSHELALNPDGFNGRSDAEILSTLVHEMCHVWQYTCGEPPKGRYHDKAWANKMREVGLQPTTTGLAGGKETGQSVTHYILTDGSYAQAYAELQATGLQLHWESALPPTEEEKKKRSSKTKFTCPNCEQNAWGKPEAKLLCGTCFNERRIMVPMEAEDKEGGE